MLEYKFDVRFYLVAILFIIFDLEVAFLISMGSSTIRYWYIWIYINDDILFFLTIGFIYEWKKGALRMGLEQSKVNLLKAKQHLKLLLQMLEIKVLL